MSKYTVEAPNGKRVTFEWLDQKPPTDADMEQVFSAAGGSTAPATRESILREENKSMSGVNRFLVGVGSGMYELGRGIQQKGAQLGEKLGLVSPETVQGITAKGEEERAIMKPLLEESGAAQAGKIVGETVPTLAVPGGVAGKALQRAGTAALSGAGLGAARFTGEGESALSNAALGAIAGGGTSGAMSVVGKGINAIKGNVAKTAVQELADKYKIPTTLGEDIGNTTLQKTETLLEKVPLVGTRKFRERQLEAADDAAKGFLGKYIANPEKANIEGNREFSSNLFNSMKDSIKDVKDLPIYATKTADKARELLESYPDIFKKFQNVKREQIINDILKTPKSRNIDNPAIKRVGTFTFGTNVKGKVQPKLFEDMWTLRDGLGEMIGQAKTKLRSGDVDRTTISQLNGLYKAVNDDIDKWAGSVGKPELRNAINSANDAYKRYVVKYSLLQKAYDDAAGITSAKEMFSPKTFSTSLKKIIAKDKEYKSFKPDEIKEMTGLANIMQVVKRAGQYAENPPTGNRLIDAGVTGGLGFGAGTVGIAATAQGTAVGAATTTVLKLLTTTKAGKNLLRAASKVEPGSPQMQKIFDKIYQIAPRVVGSMEQNDISPSMPDLVSSAEAGEISPLSWKTNKHMRAIEEAAAEPKSISSQPTAQAISDPQESSSLSASNIRQNDSGEYQMYVDGDFDSKWITLSSAEVSKLKKQGRLFGQDIEQLKKRGGI